jgi:hypothetical protein
MLAVFGLTSDRLALDASSCAQPATLLRAAVLALAVILTFGCQLATPPDGVQHGGTDGPAFDASDTSACGFSECSGDDADVPSPSCNAADAVGIGSGLRETVVLRVGLRNFGISPQPGTPPADTRACLASCALGSQASCITSSADSSTARGS